MTDEKFESLFGLIASILIVLLGGLYIGRWFHQEQHSDVNPVSNSVSTSDSK